MRDAGRKAELSALLGSEIARRIADGADVSAAYREAAREALRAPALSALNGKPLHEALDALDLKEARRIVEDMGPFAAFDPRTLTIIVSGGGVKDVPDATCVAARLRDKPNPTRKDIEEAFAACSSKPS